METRPALPEKESRSSALSGSARSLIETCQPASQPVGGRLVNHRRRRERFDKVTRTRPAGSSFLVNPRPGLWKVVGAAGFQAAVGTRAPLERVSSRGGTFHSRRTLHCRHRIHKAVFAYLPCSLRFRSRRRTGCAAPCIAEVDGSEPFWTAWIGSTGCDICTAHANARRGVLPSAFK